VNPGDATSHDVIAERTVAQAGNVIYPVRVGVGADVVIDRVSVILSIVLTDVKIPVSVIAELVVNAGVLAGPRTSPTELQKPARFCKTDIAEGEAPEGETVFAKPTHVATSPSNLSGSQVVSS